MPKTPLQAELQKANRRIKALERQMEAGEIHYKKTTQRMIDTLKDKAAELTGVTHGDLRIGALQYEDREAYLRILKRFNQSAIGTKTLQEKLMKENKRKFEETYGRMDEDERVIPYSDEEYEELVNIFESDEFGRFTEKYKTYSGVIKEMAANPATYKEATEFLKEMMQPANEDAITHASGALDVDAFIKLWKGRFYPVEEEEEK